MAAKKRNTAKSPDEAIPADVFELAPDGLVVIDADGLIVRANRRFEDMFGHDRNDLVAKSLAMIVPDFEATLIAELPVARTARHRSGADCPVEITSARLGPRRTMLAVRAAPARHQPHELLQMVRAEQMAAIGQVAAGVAHELRNPLTSIKGLVQVNLRDAIARGLPTEDLAVIEHEVRRMERTLQTFLDFARPPQPDRRRLDLATIVERVYALVGGRARKQEVQLRFLRPDRPVWVDGDQDQLQQLLLNLILNALDALARGGVVEVDLRPSRDRFVELFVRDTGPGIAAHILPKVFETFVSSKETGIGLGLPVSLRIAEDHGGRLSASNPPTGGACFALQLPASDDAPAAPHRGEEDAKAAGRR